MNHGKILIKFLEIIKTLTLKEYVSAFLEKDLRTDQRTLKEKRQFNYKYNVLDLVSPSASGILGNNKIILVMKKKETRIEENSLNFVIDFSSETSLITEENLRAFLSKLTRNNIDIGQNQELTLHIKVLNQDGNITDCIANTMLHFLQDISRDKSLADSYKITVKNVLECQTYCLIDQRLICDPTNEEVSISSVYFSMIKVGEGFLFFKIRGGILPREILKSLA